MINLNLLETFRTKKELIKYFEENGESITEEEIEALKKSYEQTETNSNTLAIQQLDEVAGGAWEAVGRFFHGAMKLFTGVLAVQAAVHHPVPEALKDHATGSEICVTMDDRKHCFGTIGNPDSTSMFDACIPQFKGENFHLLCFDPNYLESHPGSTCAPRVGYNDVFDRGGNRLTTPLEPIPLDCKEKGTPTVDRESIAEVHDYPYLQVEM